MKVWQDRWMVLGCRESRKRCVRIINHFDKWVITDSRDMWRNKSKRSRDVGYRAARPKYSYEGKKSCVWVWLCVCVFVRRRPAKKNGRPRIFHARTSGCRGMDEWMDGMFWMNESLRSGASSYRIGNSLVKLIMQHFFSGQKSYSIGYSVTPFVRYLTHRARISLLGTLILYSKPNGIHQN